MPPLEETDAMIVRCLQENARISFKELGERVHLSPNAARDCVQGLVTRRVITGFHAHVDDGRMDRRVHALVDIRVRSPDEASVFEELIRVHPCVETAVHLTGRADYSLRVACDDPAQLDDLIRALKERGGVRDTETRLVLGSVF